MSPAQKLLQYIVFTREGIELTVLGTFDDREEANLYIKELEPGKYSLASLIVLDGEVRPPERNRPTNVFEGGTRFIKRPRSRGTSRKGK